MAQAKTDLTFRVSLLRQENTQNIEFILNTLKTVDYSIGSKGDPSVQDLNSALQTSNKVRTGLTTIEYTQNKTDAYALLDELSNQVKEVAENTVNVIRSKSYGFYTPEEKESIGENGNRINEIKNKNIELLEAAYKLKSTPGVEKIIESAIKTNKALSIMPMAKNGPDQPKILSQLENVVSRNTKTLQQLEFQQNYNGREIPKVEPQTSKKEIQEIEVQEPQP